MNRYNNGRIYKIIDNTTGLQYIGSTCLPTLAKRLSQHRGKYKAYLNGKANHVSSFDIMKNNDYCIILIEDYSCETKEQLLMRERYHIENNICVNKRIPSRTAEEICEYHRKTNIIYYNTNKEMFKKRYNCECGGKFTYRNRSVHLKSKKHLDYISN